MAYPRLAQGIREFLEGPLARPALMRWRRKQFLSAEGATCYFGVFPSFEQARRSLPVSSAFDTEALTEEYVSVRTRKVFAYDYPVLWWLARAFKNSNLNVLDIGGSVGVHFYAYQKFLELPKGLLWTIAELPAVARIGKRLAQERQAKALVFKTDLHDAVTCSDADIWMAAGSLQYLEHPSVPDLLHRSRKLPEHILLNKLPLYGGATFVTTQNLGCRCFSPVHVFNRNEFIDSIVSEGFQLKDEWPVHERAMYLPGFSQRSFPSFSGLYFAKETNTAS